MFVDLRGYWVSAAIVHRRPSFLANRDWISVPWASGAPPKDIFHRLLDIGAEIPAFLAQVDEFTVALDDFKMLPSDLMTLQSALWEKGVELDRRLQVWKITWADTYPSGMVSEAVEVRTEPGDGNFPVFRCHNISTLEIVTPTLLEFPDLLLAQSMCYYWALRLVISAADSGVVSVVSPQERYQIACDICRSMKYYVTKSPGCLPTRMMFVLRVVFDTFPDGMIERDFVVTLFSYLGKKLKLSTFTNRCPDSSVKVETIA